MKLAVGSSHVASENWRLGSGALSGGGIRDACPALEDRAARLELLNVAEAFRSG